MERRLSPIRRVLFGLVLGAAMLFACEALCFVALSWIGGEFFSASEWQWKRVAAMARFSVLEPVVATIDVEEPWVLHPYLGFVIDPSGQKYRAPVSEYGFSGSAGPIQTRSPNKIIIGIFGGSVAEHFAESSADELVDALAQAPEFHGRESIVFRTAMGGYKQPQQLMALNYILALGGEVDILINIDGFNEVALHATENALRDTFPVYPRNWWGLATPLHDPQLRRLVARRDFLSDRITSVAKRHSRDFLSVSAIANTIWFATHSMLMRDFAEAERALWEVETQNHYVTTGPSLKVEEDLYEHLAAIRMRSSLQMDRLSLENEIRYFHFLQPNQYFSEAKPMGAKEQKAAYAGDQPYRVGAELGFSSLLRQGAALVEQGVNFTDLSRVFDDVEEALYTDSCCHFNEVGNRILAKHIARVILDDLR